jgi:hypothetical protein
MLDDVPARTLLVILRMHLVAREDPKSRRWHWQIVDAEGVEIAASSEEYASIGEALEAGRTRFLHVVREHTPTATHPRGYRRRGAV